MWQSAAKHLNLNRYGESSTTIPGEGVGFKRIRSGW